MKLADFLDMPVQFWRREAPDAVVQSQDMLKLVPVESKCLAQAYEVLVRLNAEEIRRFDAWTRKAGSLLTASGLMLSLCSLGLPRLQDLQTSNGLVQFLTTSVLLIAVGAFFLATWNALMSIRARPYCVNDESSFCDVQNKPSNHDAMLKELAASELAAYRNNIVIVNAKGTSVNSAFWYFFLGCCCEAVFVIAVLLARVPSIGAVH